MINVTLKCPESGETLSGSIEAGDNVVDGVVAVVVFFVVVTVGLSVIDVIVDPITGGGFVASSFSSISS